MKNKTRVHLYLHYINDHYRNKSAMSVPKIWMNKDELVKHRNSQYDLIEGKLKRAFGSMNKKLNIDKNNNSAHETLNRTYD